MSVGDAVRLPRDDGGFDRDLFRVCAFLAHIADPEDSITDAQIIYPFAYCTNDSRKVAPQDIGELRNRTVLT